MKAYPAIPVVLSLTGILALSAPSRCWAVEGAEGVTAVASKVSRDYVRTRLPDGSFQPETYAFGNGGNWPGPFSDDTIDKLGFMDVARVIASPLVDRDYIPAKDPNRTRLLIMVYWGATTAPQPISMSPGYQDYQALMTRSLPVRGGASNSEATMFTLIDMANKQRDDLDYRNAAMLGYNYDSEALLGTEWGAMIELTALKGPWRELLSEIEYSRYFVVLMAYDFQMMWKQGQHKLLWETRFSINQPHNDFGKALPVMAQFASQYFGQDSHGLVRHPIPEGRVEVHEPTLIELFEGSRK